jgi:hypothetical protein
MAGQYSTSGKEHTLRREIHRHIARQMFDVQAFKVDPHGMSGVCEAAGGECVSRKKKAEITGQESLRNRYERQKYEANARSE